MAKEHPYIMTLSLNILNHLGLNLYGNTPAVIAEVVANSWDADAEKVEIEIDRDNGKVVITDDGHGMTRDEINEKYLTVGYRRRASKQDAVTPKWGRSVTGRKGIGKLALFSVAHVIELHTVRDGGRSGFRMVLEDIQAKIEGKEEGTYKPDPIDADTIKIDRGTRLILADLKKGLRQTETALRRRLARRFSIIGEKHHFSVSINSKPISIDDRDYYYKVQYLWRYGDEEGEYLRYCKNQEHEEEREAEVMLEDGNGARYQVKGWIGTVSNAGYLKDKDGEDNLNRILILVRGKLAKEDILEGFTEGGVYSKYLIGEINADFLDIDTEEDTSTSDRQGFLEHDPRFQALREFIYQELKYIQSKWTHLRNLEGKKIALKIPAIENWFKTLSRDHRRKAESLFGKINQLTVESEEKKRLFQHSVLAFESFRYKQNLDALEQITPDNIEALADLFGELDDIEATLYYQIVSERIQVIQALHQKVEQNVLEKLIQEHIFHHLWLLDASWERATETPFMEKTVKKAFDTINAKLSREEKSGRLDIKYKNPSGKHVIVELKRADRRLSTEELLGQTRKYRNALKKILHQAGKGHEPVEVVCIVGKELKDWEDETSRKESEDTLKPTDTRVVLYQELIENAYLSYRAFLEKKVEAGRVLELIKSIDMADVFGTGQ